MFRTVAIAPFRWRLPLWTQQGRTGTVLNFLFSANSTFVSADNNYFCLYNRFNAAARANADVVDMWFRAECVYEN